MVLLTYSTIQSQTKVVPEEVSADIIKNSYSTLGKYKLSIIKKSTLFFISRMEESFQVMAISIGDLICGKMKLNL